ncbi:hypothetical protein KYC5002_47750 [Archangium violaceum]|uniref:hypothetical protein n=1 Tax=Archangium violaceum TaxID=83451 RepID=UPI002B2A341F|nr:hypothetical protein KYC5002_47750 [Archangium gephyra]
MDGTQESARGHLVLTATGFQGHARLLSLGWAALEDLLHQEPELRGLPHGRTGLILCLPDLESRRSRPPPPTTPPQNPEVSHPHRIPPSSPEGRELCAQLTRLGKLSIPEANWSDIRWGHAGPALAIHKALQSLRTRDWNRCLIGGFDSLVDPNALEWLHDVRRLRVPDKPDGIIPGEAASFILLERFDAARERGANTHAVVTEAAATHESHHYMARQTSTALALAEAISRVLSTSHDPAPDQVWLIGDHNGETYRAHEWGCMLVRLAAQFPSLRVNDTWFPASSFGDTGAASMTLGICMAVRAFRRGYHRAPTALITASSDAGLRGALCIGQHETI